MRQPYNVLVFLFCITAEGPRYALFKRSELADWQSVSGGVQVGEDLVAAARREVEDETGISDRCPVYKLDMVGAVGKAGVAPSRHRPQSPYIVPKHYFAMDLGGGAHEIIIPAEYREFRWASHAEAEEALRHDEDKTALWELEARLHIGDLPESTA